jgi:hypothetical protein
MAVTPELLNVKADTSTRLVNLQLTGNLEVAGTQTVTGDTTYTGSVTAADLIATDDVTVGDDLVVTGLATIGETLVVTGVLTASGGVKRPVQAAAADGAITIRDGVVIITKAGVAVLTLAAPTAVVHDGITINIIAGTANAHTVTVTGAAGGSGQDVGTFGGAVNDSTTLVAYNAQWYILGAPRNVTWA